MLKAAALLKAQHKSRLEIMMKKLLILLTLLCSPQALATECTTDCGAKADFQYPCPTPMNPGRKCTGRNPAIFSACETEKGPACEDMARGIIAAGRSDRLIGECVEVALAALIPTSICAACIVSAIGDPTGAAIWCSLASCYYAGTMLAQTRDICNIQL